MKYTIVKGKGRNAGKTDEQLLRELLESDEVIELRCPICGNLSLAYEHLANHHNPTEAELVTCENRPSCGFYAESNITFSLLYYLGIRNDVFFVDGETDEQMPHKQTTQQEDDMTDKQVLSESAIKAMGECGIPDYMHGGLARYFNNGIEPGGFLSAVLNNDLMMALDRADSQNVNCLKAYGMWLYNHAPMGTFGYSGAVDEYLARFHGDKP